MKAGDKVWVPVYVIREFRGHVDLAASERDMHKGNIALTLMVDDIVSPLSDDGPPDHPALPAVARWIADMPELLPLHLRRAIEQYIAHGVFARDMKTTEALRSLRALLAALTTEEA